MDHYSLSAEIQRSGIQNIRREENGIGTSLGVIIDLFDNSFLVSHIVVTVLVEYNSKCEKVVLSIL